ncbi:hypothetical protein [Pseudonocardia charpentierae]|uniref:Uncharacterized protein n=1 Tax=Pseudonocardia charpentierae TaxID=3075545 RepID=A0ABU2NGE7_9PSEU|nr:hypothetical protein [Pseudonocardia sp. DSM 45834]MDT0353043.1 hypothetical protein [Pseudonocardia sp. DSM 45834]
MRFVDDLDASEAVGTVTGPHAASAGAYLGDGRLGGRPDGRDLRSEALALQHTVLGAALRTGAVTPEDRASVGVSDNAFAAALTEYLVALPPSQGPVNFVTASANGQRDAVKTAILNAPEPVQIPVTSDAWDNAAAQASDAVNQAGTEVRTALTAAAATR